MSNSVMEETTQMDTATIDSGPTESAEIKAQLRAFGEAYSYDASYLEEVLDVSPGAFAAFSPAQPMSSYRSSLPLDAHFVARVSAMQGEDCGPCAQLNLRMAVEAGVDRALLETLIRSPEGLPAELRDVHEHALAVCRGDEIDADRARRIRNCYGEEAFAELAVVITGCRIFPTLKRALDRARHCEILHLDF